MLYHLPAWSCNQRSDIDYRVIVKRGHEPKPTMTSITYMSSFNRSENTHLKHFLRSPAIWINYNLVCWTSGRILCQILGHTGRDRNITQHSNWKHVGLRLDKQAQPAPPFESWYNMDNCSTVATVIILANSILCSASPLLVPSTPRAHPAEQSNLM